MKKLNNVIEKDILKFCKKGKTIKQVQENFKSKMNIEEIDSFMRKGWHEKLYKSEKTGIYIISDLGISSYKMYKKKDYEKNWLQREYKWVIRIILIIIGLVITYYLNFK